MARESGFTIIELVVVMGLMAILMGIATVNLVEMANPALSGANEIAGFMKRVRAKGLATTSAYFIEADSTTTVTTSFGTSCADASPSPDAQLTLQLQNAFMSDISWNVCFNSRGFPDANITVPVSDTYSGNAIVEVLLGGAVRVQ